MSDSMACICGKECFYFANVEAWLCPFCNLSEILEAAKDCDEKLFKRKREREDDERRNNRHIQKDSRKSHG